MYSYLAHPTHMAYYRYSVLIVEEQEEITWTKSRINIKVCKVHRMNSSRVPSDIHLLRILKDFMYGMQFVMKIKSTTQLLNGLMQKIMRKVFCSYIRCINFDNASTKKQTQVCSFTKIIFFFFNFIFMIITTKCLLPLCVSSYVVTPYGNAIVGNKFVSSTSNSPFHEIFLKCFPIISYLISVFFYLDSLIHSLGSFNVKQFLYIKYLNLLHFISVNCFCVVTKGFDFLILP